MARWEPARWGSTIRAGRHAKSRATRTARRERAWRAARKSTLGTKAVLVRLPEWWVSTRGELAVGWEIGRLGALLALLFTWCAVLARL